MQQYLDIINHFGVRAQMKKCNEEMFEFLEAVDNYEDSMVEAENPHSYIGYEELHVFREHVIEEMGDLLVLLTQFIALYQIDKEELDKHMDYKLDRTLKYIHSLLEKGGKLDENCKK